MDSNKNMQEYLTPAYFVDSDNPAIIAYAQAVTQGLDNDVDKAVKLYYTVRDKYLYNPYILKFEKEDMKASSFLGQKSGYCGEKACLLAALGRAIGIPTRLGFGSVKNHIGTAEIEKLLKTDVLAFHGYTEFYLNGKWVKATPAFNKGLCDKLGVAPLEFDGLQDSLFQEYDKQGGKFMEYVEEFGTFADIPRDLMIKVLKHYYPHLFEEWMNKRKSQTVFLRASA